MNKRLKQHRHLLEDHRILQGLLHSFAIPTYIIDKQHRVIHWNRAMEALTGIAAAKILDKTDHWRAFYRTHHPCLIDLLVDGKLVEIETLYGPGGTMPEVLEDAHEFVGYYPGLGDEGKWLRVTASVLRDDQGQVIGAVETMEDITEHKRADEERESLVVELQNALAKIKTLKGLLPICASCKKIRNDKGYWEQIENYLHDHSEAEFSHGICPECAKKLYPKYYRSKK